MAILRKAAADESLLKQNCNLFRSCLLCAKCEKACPAHLPLAKIFLAHRLNLENQSRKNLIEKAEFSFFHTPAFDPVRPLLKLFSERKPGEFKNAFHFRKKNTPPEKGKESVLLFPGCIGKKVRPALLDAAFATLKSLGYAPISPGSLRCCGKMQGFTRKSLVAACRANLKILMKIPFARMAVICPACLDMIRNVWPTIGELASEERLFCANLSRQVQHIGRFFEKLHQPVAENQKALWHGGCLLEEEDSRAIMTALGLSAEGNVSPGCCGGACAAQKPAGKVYGIMAKNPSVAEKLAKIRRDELIVGNPEAVITGCPHCQLALENIFTKSRDKIRVFHAAEYYFSHRRERN